MNSAAEAGPRTIDYYDYMARAVRLDRLRQTRGKQGVVRTGTAGRRGRREDRFHTLFSRREERPYDAWLRCTGGNSCETWSALL
jgi:hypothetical protein